MGEIDVGNEEITAGESDFSDLPCVFCIEVLECVDSVRVCDAELGEDVVVDFPVDVGAVQIIGQAVLFLHFGVAVVFHLYHPFILGCDCLDLIGCYHGTVGDLEGTEAATVDTTGIDADVAWGEEGAPGIIEVDGGGVAEDDGFPCGGRVQVELFADPEQVFFMLVSHGDAMPDATVDVNEMVIFKVETQALKKGQIVCQGVAVSAEVVCGGFTVTPAVGVIVDGHLLVVAPQEYDVVFAVGGFQCDQPFDYGVAVGAAVNIVTEHNQAVAGKVRLDCIQHVLELIVRAVNITDNECFHL